MRKINFLGRLVSLLIAIVAVNSCQSPVIQEDGMGTDLALKNASMAKQSYIIQLNDPALVAELQTTKGYQMRKNEVRGKALGLLKKQGITGAELGYTYSNSIVGFSVKIAPGQVKKLLADGTVKSIHEDKIITLAPPPGKGPGNGGGKGGGGGGGTSGQTTPWGITEVGGSVNYTGSGKAWIIDTGVDYTHPDLNVDTKDAANFTHAKSADDDNGHGSHVAGIIAAIDNNEGVVGVAAGATVVPVKVLDRHGSGQISDVIAGVDYVAANGVDGDVANMSLGGGFYQPLNDAVLAASAHVKFAIAAGNESTDASTKSPASTEGSNIYTVSAMDRSEDFAYFSNYGNSTNGNPVDYCAPGVSIKSCYKDGGYATLSGTSMAAPHVAGILLLGSIQSNGTVNGDPDGNPDPIAHE